MAVFLLWLAGKTGLSDLVVKLIVLAVVVLLIVAAVVGFAWHERNIGWDKAIAAVAAKDKEALDAVHQATDKVDACYSSGGSWDTTSGLCVK